LSRLKLAILSILLNLLTLKLKTIYRHWTLKEMTFYNIIISQRKVRLAKRVRNDIYERALKNNDLKSIIIIN